MEKAIIFFRERMKLKFYEVPYFKTYKTLEWLQKKQNNLLECFREIVHTVGEKPCIQTAIFILFLNLKMPRFLYFFRT